MCVWIGDPLVVNGAYPQNMMTKLDENKAKHVPTYDQLVTKEMMTLILIILVEYTLLFTMENTLWFVTLILVSMVVILYAFGM